MSRNKLRDIKRSGNLTKTPLRVNIYIFTSKDPLREHLETLRKPSTKRIDTITI